MLLTTPYCVRVAHFVHTKKNTGMPCIAYFVRTECVVVAYFVFFISGVPITIVRIRRTERAQVKRVRSRGEFIHNSGPTKKKSKVGHEKGSEVCSKGGI